MLSCSEHILSVSYHGYHVPLSMAKSSDILAGVLVMILASTMHAAALTVSPLMSFQERIYYTQLITLMYPKACANTYQNFKAQSSAMRCSRPQSCAQARQMQGS